MESLTEFVALFEKCVLGVITNSAAVLKENELTKKRNGQTSSSLNRGTKLLILSLLL